MLFVKSYCPHHTDCAPAISIFPDNSSGLSDAIEYCVLRIEEGGRVFTIKVFDDEIPIQVPEGMNNASGHEIAAFLLIELHAGLGDILASHLAAFDTYGLSEADESDDPDESDESIDCVEAPQNGARKPTIRHH